MSWLAISDKHSSVVSQGFKRLAQRPDSLMQKGSVVIEARTPTEDKLRTILGHMTPSPDKSRFAIQALPGGGIAFVATRGHEILHTSLPVDSKARADVLRITLSWDSAMKAGWLSIERPEVSKSEQKRFDLDRGFCVRQLLALVTNNPLREIAPDALFVALSDQVEPIGPNPGLLGGTPVLTPEGYRDVRVLKRGDVVETLNGTLVPVLHVVSRTVPARGLFRPLRLRHPYLGLQSDIVVSPTQRLVIGGSRVEYMFGTEQVLVPARHLANGTAALPLQSGPLVRYHQLVLPDHEAVQTAGTFVETLDIGRLRRRPTLLRASLLNHIDRHLLPEHSRTAYPVLGAFEALTLAEQRAA